METEKLQKKLTEILGDRFSTSDAVKSNYAKGEDIFDPIFPIAVVFPKNNEEISNLVKFCSENSIPIVPFGSGTSLEGNVVANNQGITISGLLTKLKITKQSLNRVLRDLIKNKAIIVKKGEIDSRQTQIYLNEKGKKLFDEIFIEQKKRIYNALKNSDSASVIKFKNVLNKIINE